MREEPDIRITKLDAAWRQLRTAIELWFADTSAAFLTWMGIQNPHWFDPDEVRKHGIPADRLDAIRKLDKAEFFKGYLELRRERRAAGLP